MSLLPSQDCCLIHWSLCLEHIQYLQMATEPYGVFWETFEKIANSEGEINCVELTRRKATWKKNDWSCHLEIDRMRRFEVYEERFPQENRKRQSSDVWSGSALLLYWLNNRSDIEKALGRPFLSLSFLEVPIYSVLFFYFGISPLFQSPPNPPVSPGKPASDVNSNNNVTYR